MTETTDDKISTNYTQNREHHPSSSSNSSIVSTRRDSLRSHHPGNGHNPLTPTSPPLRFTRKRAASIDTDVANQPRIEDLALNTPSAGISVSAGEKICLCQPDPKIPRPRNAFILYRQHHQVQVVQSHPGLANPEISKIIGEQWRDQPPGIKNYWKRLAEEEKKRHQRLYPDYRYQPRRAGAPTRPLRLSSSEDPERCSKCNGRYILVPNAPLTPQISSFQDRARPLPPSLGSSTPAGPPQRSATIDGRVRFPSIPMDPPRTAPLHPSFRRPGFAQTSATLQAGSLRENDRDLEMLDLSPEMKRRRYNNHQSYASSSPHDQRFIRPSMPTVGYHDPRRQPPISSPFHPSPRSSMIGPAPRSSPSYYPNMQHTSNIDESLRLPPLQNRNSNLGLNQVPSRRQDNQASGVEAMIMTIPCNNKIRVLSRISLPLTPSGPTSPMQDIRGVVVAIEGAQPALLAEVGHFISEHLNKELDYFVKTFTSPPRKITESEKPLEVEMKGASVSDSSLPNTAHTNPFIAYLKTIEYWHERSQEIIQFITTVPASSLPVTSNANSTPLPNLTVAPQPTPTSSKIPSDSGLRSAEELAATISTTSVPILQSQKPQIPIALLPQGFSLTMSDVAAVSIPINDAYAPVDHWQWMATLWRGIVRADLVIYVKAVQTGHATPMEHEGAEEMARFGAVEVRRDCGPWTVIVRVPIGPESGRGNGMGAFGGVNTGQMYAAAGKNWKVEEATLRRLGFEVLEVLRADFGKSRCYQGS